MTTLHEAARQALKWIEAQPEPRMFGARTAIEVLTAALEESQSDKSNTAPVAANSKPDKPAAWRFRPWVGAKHWAYSEWDPHEFCNHDCEAEPLYL